MTEMWPLWLWLIGAAWTWRHHVGYILDDMSGGCDPDGSDWVIALLVGTIGCFLWPASTAGRMIYVLWKKYGEDNSGTLSGFFPGPKEIETRWEKQERKAREKDEENRALRQRIRELEQETGVA